MREPSVPRRDGPSAPEYNREAIRDLLRGDRRLREEFRSAALREGERDAIVIEPGAPDPPVIRLDSGFAYRASRLPDGRRIILDLLISGDITGIDHVLLSRSVEGLVAANRITYQALAAERLRQLATDRAVAARVLTLLAEARWRGDRLAASLARLDAEGRVGVMLLDIHDRLLRRGLINGPRFNLPLTQEQIADHLGLTLVHVNRILRRLREERIALIDRQIVVIEKLDLLRELARGLPQPAILADPPPLHDWSGP
jgi:CRP-like cAMP-binding protein